MENSKRVNASKIYGILGGMGLVCFIVVKHFNCADIIHQYGPSFLWCFGWSSVGIALGLWNSREDGDKKDDQRSKWNHYLTYFPFVFVIAGISSFIILFDGGPKSYALSALTAITIGFSGDALAGIIKNLGNLNKQ